MTEVSKFDEIRPYRGEKEILEAIQRIVEDETFFGFAEQMFAGKTLQKMREKLKTIKTVEVFQSAIIVPLIQKLIDKTSEGFAISGLENLDKDKSYLFISNHRDIIMDSALLCYGLEKHGFQTTEIAIGSNLLLRPWINDLVKLNKSFIVKRGKEVGLRDQLSNAKELSNYILDTLANRKESIWLAQREGRTKDGNDGTQLSLLKMLNLAGDKDIRKHFKVLNIVPVSISYEYEPCAGLKTRELYMRTTPEGYEKTKKDDLLSMFTGLKQQKGRICFSIGKPIMSETTDSFQKDLTDSEFLEQMANLIDKHIVMNYGLFPDNYIASDIINGEQKYAHYYTEKEKGLFVKYMERELENIEGITPLHRELFLKIYANPVWNKQKYEL